MMAISQPTSGDSSAAELGRRKPIAGFAGGPGGGAVWLDGKQPLTACPKCHGPMPVRVWLSLAECPSCGTSVRLTEAQEQQALALLRQAASPTGGHVVSEPASETVASAAEALPKPTAELPAAVENPQRAGGHAPVPLPQSIASTAGLSHNGSRPASATANQELPSWSLATQRFLVCWLASAVVHLFLVLMLGLWLINKETRERLVLAATISDQTADDRVEQIDTSTMEAPVDADDPALTEISAPAEAPTTDEKLMAALTTVEKPPGELLPMSELAKLPIGQLSPSQVLAGRDPAYRGQLVAREGGTSASEAAVARALAWLAKHQSQDGRWSLDHFDTAGDCNGRCGDPGIESDTAATALALLPFLGAGQTHLRGDYTQTVARGLRALMDMERSDGDLRGSGGGNMYAHGQATIALCEAYALTQADNLREPAQRAVDFIIAAQHEAGGWRYRPGEPGDLSVVGWQMMALRSAQMAYLKVPEETFLKATRFLNSVQQSPSLGQYCYLPGSGSSPVMTAEGLLCRQYSGWRHNHPVLLNGVRWLEENQLPQAKRANMYFWYYGTQVMHHMGGPAWEKWNAALRDLLISLQAVSGHEAGSWPPLGGHDARGGRVYTTALAACTLEVYYRHLPLYRGAATGGPTPSPRKR
ncbi:MAG TPA: prenyltransferase/squalene oxidase repeat-containing protein [Pirellulales bacterium]|nr:prenyltransferase/squalene oxidase repeat-containing protein [Pirellulales bacterium]